MENGMISVRTMVFQKLALETPLPFVVSIVFLEVDMDACASLNC